MSDTCLSQSCTVKSKEMALVIGPCGIFEYNEDGSLICPDKADIGEFDENTPWWYEDAKSVTITPNREITNESCLRCKNVCEADIDSQSMSIELVRCLENRFHCDLASINSTCQFSFMLFIKPKNCEMPDPATDAFYYGVALGGASEVGGAASDTQGQRLNVEAQSCGKLWAEKNFCNETAPVGEGVTNVLTEGELQQGVQEMIEDKAA